MTRIGCSIILWLVVASCVTDRRQHRGAQAPHSSSPEVDYLALVLKDIIEASGGQKPVENITKLLDVKANRDLFIRQLQDLKEAQVMNIDDDSLETLKKGMDNWNLGHYWQTGKNFVNALMSVFSQTVGSTPSPNAPQDGPQGTSRQDVARAIHERLTYFFQGFQLPTGDIDFGPTVPSAWIQTLQQYPSKLPLDSKRALVADLLTKIVKEDQRLGVPSAVDKFTVLTKHSGPIMRKLLQKIVENLPDNMADQRDELSGALQSNDNIDMTPEEKDRLLTQVSEDLGIDKSQLEVRREASIAWGVRVQQSPPKTPFFLKVRHPRIVQAFEEDRIRITQVLDDLNLPALKWMFDDLVKQMRFELDFNYERKNIDKANAVYGGKHSRIHVIKRHSFDSKIAGNSLLADRYLAMTEAPGDTLTKYLKTDQFAALSKTQQKQLANLSIEWRDLWHVEAFARSRFFHGDPHPGNFHVDFSKGHPELWVLDLGNAAVGSEAVTYGVLRSGMGLQYKKSAWVVEGLKNNLAKGATLPPEIKHLVETRVLVGDPSRYARNLSRLTVAKDIRLKPDFTNLLAAVLSIGDWGNRFKQNGYPLPEALPHAIKGHKPRFAFTIARGYVARRPALQAVLGAGAVAIAAGVAYPVIHVLIKKPPDDDWNEDDDWEKNQPSQLQADLDLAGSAAAGSCRYSTAEGLVLCLRYPSSSEESWHLTCTRGGGIWDPGPCPSAAKESCRLGAISLFGYSSQTSICGELAAMLR